MSDAQEWYVLIGAEERGPLSGGELRALARDLRLRREDRVRRPGMGDWRPAGDIDGLFTTSAALNRASAGADGEHPADRGTPEILPVGKTVRESGTAAGLAQTSIPLRSLTARRSNYVARHWRGDMSLAQSYWVNHIYLNFAILIVIGTLIDIITVSAYKGLIGPFVAINIFLLFIVGFATWQFVGTFRSANKHRARGGKRVWAIAVQVAIILGAFGEVFVLSKNVVPAYHKMASVIFIDEPRKSLTITADATRNALVLRGDIKLGAYAQFKAALDAAPTAKSLALTSNGGWLNEGERIAKLVRARGLATVAVGPCLSACALIFAAGEQRWIGAQGRVGFHAPRNPVTGTTTEEDVREERQLLVLFGLPGGMADKAVSTPTSSMWLPTVSELRSAQVIQGEVDEQTYATSGLLKAGYSAQEASKILLSVPLYNEINKVEPEQFSRMITAMVDLYDRGGIDKEQSLIAAEPILLQVVRKYLPVSSDATIIEMAKIKMAYMQRLRQDDVAGCVAFAEPEKFPSGTFELSRYEDLNVRALDLSGRAVREGAAAPARVPTDEELATDFATILGAVDRALPGNMILSQNKNLRAADFPSLCDLNIAIFSEILNRPIDRAVLVLRNVFYGLGN